MAECKFCGQRFRSKQAVKAHLKGCAAYKGNVPEGLPKATAMEAGFDPAPDVRSELADEVARLRLRRVRAAHTALDEREQEARARAYDRIRAQLKAEADARDRRRKDEEAARDRKQREEAEAGRAKRRREIIQRVKTRVIQGLGSLSSTIPPETRAEALQQIERRLSALAVDEIPESELVAIGEGIRDACYRPVMQAQDAAKVEAEARRQQEDAPRQDAEGRRQEVAARQAELLRYGTKFVSEDLSEHLELNPEERAEILNEVTRALDEELTGTESEVEVEELIDEMLFDLLDAADDEQEDADTQEEDDEDDEQ